MQKSSMTLIEILIALFVFAVGILAVVRVITTNIAVIDTMKLKVQAQSLAKEGMDIIFNIRDTNLARGVSRQCAYLNPDAISKIQNNLPYAGAICWDSFGAGKVFRVAADPAGKVLITSTNSWTDFASAFSQNQLMELQSAAAEYTGILLTYGQWTGSYFARFITFSTVSQSGSVLDTDRLLKVTSHVLYQKWSIQGEVTLESFIWAIKK